ncbi:SCO2322 family protein [Kribbella sp. NPDC051718]|uniref:SCO2322 family protein n=1 Tax=Kribbella sp. NPDC051718 TaxID=3155168 RepID=UPI00342A5F71
MIAKRLVLTLLTGLLLAGTATTTAQAEDGYRFWGYYQYTGGQWAFAQKGSEAVVPADGAVEGWRFAVGGAKPRVPRAAGDFSAICGATPAETGKKRVALVIDSGTPADSASGATPPPATGTCVVTDPKATGAKILAAVKPVRIEKGLTCAIDGYPATGCGDQVKNISVPATDEPVKLEIGAAVGAAPVPSASPSPSADSQPAKSHKVGWAGGVLILLIAVGGYLTSRRRTKFLKQ